MHYPAVPEEFLPCAFGDAAQLAISKVATANITFPHLRDHIFRADMNYKFW